jgi:hypothetical protein
MVEEERGLMRVIRGNKGYRTPVQFIYSREKGDGRRLLAGRRS